MAMEIELPVEKDVVVQKEVKQRLKKVPVDRIVFLPKENVLKVFLTGPVPTMEFSAVEVAQISTLAAFLTELTAKCVVKLNA